ncbi:MAG TPA: glycerol-3-phosphate dehydrogenase, partial [Burkholderiaceae bacterium]|nr:glycerol-3-phosphate dehydrogenase [Burkholderiaceae bacterium]
MQAETIPAEVDVLVVGGGVNGAGIARDLAGRALSVLLVEQHDLASHTSSSSTKLIHGGLRYLEHYEFSLVRKALAEREVLLRSAPHIMWPLRFVMPHDPAMRPVWMIRIGLFLYDHLARREWLPGSHAVDLARHSTGASLKPQFTRGFVYSDGWVDDARLVVLCALDARKRGASVLTRWRCERARIDGTRWVAELADSGGATRTVRARALVNATGPWASSFLHDQLASPLAPSLRLVKGSHIVVPKLFEHDHAYIFQNADRRIIFAIPYEGDFTLIGTTDVECHGDPAAARPDPQELAYLCEQANRYLAREVSPASVVWSYSGVRPLLPDETGDPSAVTRDYQLEMTSSPAPLLSVWGGKITTFRKLAEEAAGLLCGALQAHAPAWTEGAVLPGGELSTWIAPSGRPDTDIARFQQALAARVPQLAPGLCRRWSRSYGALVRHILQDPAGLGTEVAPGLHEA